MVRVSTDIFEILKFLKVWKKLKRVLVRHPCQELVVKFYYFLFDQLIYAEHFTRSGQSRTNLSIA
jgi:hypothetical protein